ncbi:MAG: condensation domain-containing protein [Waddliaceae bacterium]
MLKALELSEYQKTFWYLYQTEGDRPFYHVGSMFHLTGEIDSNLFRETLSHLVRHHESLQTVYSVNDAGKVMVTIKDTPFSQSMIDATVFPEKERFAKGYQLAIREFERPFEIEQGDLIHSTYIKLADGEAIWILVMTHLIADLFSFNLFLSQFKMLFEAKRKGNPFPSLEKISLGSVHDAETSESVINQRQRAARYWKEELLPLPRQLKLPTDNPANDQGLDMDYTAFPLSEALSTKINHYFQSQGISLFATMMATVAAFLRKFSRDDDFILGLETANRMLAPSQNWIWPRVNQIAIRINPFESGSFNQFAKEVQTKLALALQYGDYPFHHLPDLLNIERSEEPHGFIPVKVLMQPPAAPFQLNAFDVKELPYPSHYSPFPLVFRLSKREKIISGAISYQKKRFSKETIEQMKTGWLSLIEAVMTSPDAPLPQDSTPREIVQKRKPLFARKALSVSGGDAINYEKLNPNWDFPLLVKPKVKGLKLESWLQENKDLWKPLLEKHGALLFRGFGIESPDHFEKVALSIHPKKVEYVEPSQPRPEYKEKVYVSTEYPPEEILHQHSELNYTYDWPMIGLFCCLQPPETGGETPLSDNREIIGRLDPSIRRLFTEKGVMYQRNYGDGLLVPWQKVFKTENPKEVEKYCRRNAPMTCEWSDNGGLRTRQVRPGTFQHPRTKELVWFNQSYLFHAGSLGEERFHELLKSYSEEDLPAHAYYGDGSPITFEHLEHVYKVLRNSCHFFHWEKGDVVVVDNILISHGRNPFTGTRKILACFVEPRPR